MDHFQIATVPGDGIGKDIINSAISIVNLSSEIIVGFKCNLENINYGEEYFAQ